MSHARSPWDDSRHDPALDAEECCWPTCSARTEDDTAPLCVKHFIHMGDRFMRVYQQRVLVLREQLRPTSVERTERAAREERRAAAYAQQSQVYYVRIGNHVKIGYTQNLRARLIGLRVDVEAVLATEPGGLELEQQRHREFADERQGRRENFNPSRRLLAHIDAVREQHGEPRLTGYVKVA